MTNDILERYKKIIDTMPVSVVLIDAAGVMVAINRQAVEMLGDVSGQPVETIIPEKHRENHRKHHIAFLKSPSSRPMGFGRDLLAKDYSGNEIPVEIALDTFLENGDIYVMAVLVDITNRIKNQQNLEQVIVDLREKIEYADELTRAMAKMEELLGKIKDGMK